MDSKERVKRAINFDHPDRPPISHAILPSAIPRHGQALLDIIAEVHEDFGWDFLPDLPPEKYPPYYKEGRNRDGFGTLWECSADGEYGTPVEMPLSDPDWKGYDAYRWPDFEVRPTEYRLYSGHMEGDDPRYYARGGWITFFEEMQQLRGFETLLMDLALETPEFERFKEDTLAFNLRHLDKWLQWDYDGLHFADDWGSQISMMISPDLWRKHFKPAYRTMFDKVISAGVDVHFHSDGYIIDIIPDLLDIGVKVINCQTNCMDTERIGKLFRDKVCFRTDLDRQNVMIFGTPRDVKEHIRSVFRALGSFRGGVIACGEVGRDTPLENIRAMYEEFMAFRY
ncbi:MAG: hypothetical protein EA427_04625 [Spirochaetaceae bacterium]|nr:MAG: hypothetical protein EA427_04625 [Spirochaetaceae bacterium]